MSKVSAPGRTRGQQKQDKRERIRRAAWELFLERGYEETTTRAVAERAKIASGTLFLYASDKQDLLFLIMHDRLSEAVEEAFDTLPRRAPLLEKWMHLFGRIFRMYGEHPALGAAFVRLLPGATGPNAERVNALTFAFLHRVGALVREAQEQGEVARDLLPLQVATSVFSLYFGSLMAWLAGMMPLELALEEHLRPALALQIRGLRPLREG
jgi:AcrR family transcriptional regulator